MAPPRVPVNPAPNNNISTAYTLSLLNEYTHTLDSLPLDLSRNFADLRELDAVLSSSMSSIISKIQNLTTMIENGSVPPQERLWLLTDIAEEASRLKLGGEDKIRVACQAADNLKMHSTHINTLLDHIPSFERSVLNRKTAYPHVAQKIFLPSSNTESGRRKRGAYSSLMANVPDASPKRKRVAREDELESHAGRSPRKEKVVDVNGQRQRNGPRSKKIERGASPSESVVSVTSHAPAHAPHLNNSGSSRVVASTSRTGGTTTVQNKRSRPSGGNNAGSHNVDVQRDQSASAAPREVFNTAPSSSSSHPSLPIPYGGGINGGHAYTVAPGSSAIGADWLGHPPPTQLAGPGMPVARGLAHTPLASVVSTNLAVQNVPSVPGTLASNSTNVAADGANENDGGEGEGEGDDRTYCVCNGVSYGEMIACDDQNCDREWFHLACIGLTIPPAGTWYCSTCTAKRAKRGNGRGGKRRAGGGRAGGKAANGA